MAKKNFTAKKFERLLFHIIPKFISNYLFWQFRNKDDILSLA